VKVTIRPVPVPRPRAESSATEGVELAFWKVASRPGRADDEWPARANARPRSAGQSGVGCDLPPSGPSAGYSQVRHRRPPGDNPCRHPGQFHADPVCPGPTACGSV